MNQTGGELQFSEQGRVRTGPVIGILINKLTYGLNRSLQAAHAGMITEMVRSSRRVKAVCYVFAAPDVDWQNQTVRGATLVGRPGQEVWKTLQFPLPDVVYNRVSDRTAENSEAVRLCKERFAHRKVPLFNDRFLNKRDMYDFLMADKRSVDLLPATKRMTSPQVLEEFCGQHELVYLKPAGGSLGKGICQATRMSTHYQLRYKLGSKHTTSLFKTARGMYQFIKQTFPNRTYMMQQGIHLKRYEGNVTDFRVHLHKNGKGEWEAVTIGAKVAGSGSVTTHVHNGGHVQSGDVVLSTWYGEEAQTMRQKLVDASILAATVAEGLFGGPVGELGIDAGIDDSGRVWIFETNAKPGRSIFKHPDLKKAGVRSVHLLVEYAAFLAGQQPAKGDGE